LLERKLDHHDTGAAAKDDKKALGVPEYVGAFPRKNGKAYKPNRR
jgi:hypothetical protein